MSYNRVMDDVYRLIFRGEVLEGQHPSVVKKRLAKSLKLDEAQSEKLFAGESVVLKREADTRSAAKFQALFKEAGARLRVMPVEKADTTKTPEPELSASNAGSTSEVNPKPETGAVPDAQGAFDVMPAGSDVLTNAERQADPVAEVNTDHLSVDDVGADLGPSDQPGDAPPSAPEVSHISLAEVGADIQEADETNQPTGIQVPVSDFEIAEVGSDVLSEEDKQADLTVDIDLDGYDLADVGADIGEPDKQTAPPAPDTSHLNLDSD
ncbi:MAG: hypothetical protein O7C67_09840 [Gammaproteobacteria bacterium]|nr:hypothetical protein [Gammaproteobacteria bacterium]MCZ6657586.1 hypothetical protein [Gammaproteobacteria bacterium]